MFVSAECHSVGVARAAVRPSRPARRGRPGATAAGPAVKGAGALARTCAGESFKADRMLGSAVEGLSMRDYELRRGHWKNVEGEKLLHLMQDVFQDGATEGKGYICTYGAIERLYAEYLDKTAIRIDTKMNMAAAPDVAEDTRRRFYDFLELATGYNSKERQKRLKKDVEKDAPDVEA
ncbi:MAG: DUF5611 family protein [Thermoplasmatota archaeon]